MKINIKATNLDLTPAIRSYVEEKIGGTEKFIKKMKPVDKSPEEGKATVEIWVEVERTTFHHRKGKVFRAEVQMKLPGNDVRVESKQEDLRVAIDEVKDQLERELREYSEKKRTLYEKGARKMKKLLHLAKPARFRKEEKER